jgi:Holliday junction resolvase-like predicted endonuclease
VVAHNVRFSRKEVDLVIRRGDLVAFVEVKGRRGQGYGTPELRYRFDVVGIRLDIHGRLTVEHMEDAWRTRPGRLVRRESH